MNRPSHATGIEALAPGTPRSSILDPEFWAAVYDRTATLFGDDPFPFLNYGYLDPGSGGPSPDDPYVHERLAERLYDRVLERVELAGRAVLEVGCGRGGGCARIAERYGPSSVVGLDRSAKLVDWCRSRYDSERLRFEGGDALDLPFADDSFDVVVNVESAHGYADRARFFAEVRRVLAPGGSFALTDLVFQGERRETLPEIETALRDAGLLTHERSNVTAEVLAARKLASSSDAFRRRIDALIPDLRVADGLRAAISLEGTHGYAALVDGRIEYWCWRLSTPAHRASS